MANLNFKWGLQGKIPAYDKNTTVGTVYVTTDSRAMFIDTATERIRLQGSVIYCDHLSDLQPPYEKDVLYFVRTIDDVESGPKATKVVNALLAYNDGTWVQINPDAGEFASVKNQLTSLQEKVTGFEASLTTLDDAINNETNGINKQIAGIVSILEDLVALEEDVKENTTAIKELDESMDDVIERLSSAETNITTLNTDKANKTELDAKLDKSVYDGEKTTFATKTEVARDYVTLSAYNTRQGQIDLSLSNLNTTKATKQELEDGLAGKVSQSAYDAEKVTFAKTSELGTKLDKSEFNTYKAETAVTLGNLADTKANKTDLNGKLDASRYEEEKATFAKVSDLGAKLDESKFNTYKAETAVTLGNLADTKANKTDLDGKLDTTTYEGDKATFATKTELGDKLDTSDFNDYKAETTKTLTSLGTGKADKSELETLKTTLEADIDEEIRTANSLHYMGAVAKKANLPTGNVKIGDLYVLTARDGDCEGAPGDLFVAKGNEDETSGIITSGLAWDHIHTGYDETLNHSLSLVTDEITDKDNNKITYDRITLTTFGGLGTRVGQITLKGSEGLNVNVDTDNQTVTFSNTWGTF